MIYFTHLEINVINNKLQWVKCIFKRILFLFLLKKKLFYLYFFQTTKNICILIKYVWYFLTFAIDYYVSCISQLIAIFFFICFLALDSLSHSWHFCFHFIFLVLRLINHLFISLLFSYIFSNTFNYFLLIKYIFKQFLC